MKKSTTKYVQGPRKKKSSLIQLHYSHHARYYTVELGLYARPKYLWHAHAMFANYFFSKFVRACNKILSPKNIMRSNTNACGFFLDATEAKLRRGLRYKKKMLSSKKKHAPENKYMVALPRRTLQKKDALVKKKNAPENKCMWVLDASASQNRKF